jgi:hypothetical protein
MPCFVQQAGLNASDRSRPVLRYGVQESCVRTTMHTLEAIIAAQRRGHARADGRSTSVLRKQTRVRGADLTRIVSEGLKIDELLAAKWRCCIALSCNGETHQSCFAAKQHNIA